MALCSHYWIKQALNKTRKFVLSKCTKNFTKILNDTREQFFYWLLLSITSTTNQPINCNQASIKHQETCFIYYVRPSSYLMMVKLSEKNTNFAGRWIIFYTFTNYIKAQNPTPLKWSLPFLEPFPLILENSPNPSFFSTPPPPPKTQKKIFSPNTPIPYQIHLSTPLSLVILFYIFRIVSNMVDVHISIVIDINKVVIMK